MGREGSAPPPAGGANLWVTVAPDGGLFDPQALDGGGREQATVNTALAVTIYSAVRTDSGNHDDRLLMDASRGMLAKMDDVIGSLTDFDPTDSGAPYLRELMSPQGWRTPQRINEEAFGAITIVFNISFDWDFS